MTARQRDVIPIPKTRGKRGTAAKTWKTKATVLHSQVVRARAGYRCERCGKTDARMECAHIFSRRYTSTRCDEQNAWCLCSGCHRYLTANPFEHVLFAHKSRGVLEYHALKEKAYAGTGLVAKADFWRSEVARLTALLADLEVAG